MPSQRPTRSLALVWPQGELILVALLEVFAHIGAVTAHINHIAVALLGDEGKDRLRYDGKPRMVTVRIPGLVRRYVTSTGRPSMFGTIVRLVIVQQLTRGAATALRGAARTAGLARAPRPPRPPRPPARLNPLPYSAARKRTPCCLDRKP